MLANLSQRDFCWFVYIFVYRDIFSKRTNEEKFVYVCLNPFETEQVFSKMACFIYALKSGGIDSDLEWQELTLIS